MNLAAAELHSKGGSLWRVPPGGPPVELNRRPELGRKAMVLHEEHRAALGYGGRWTHEALFRILASTGTDLTIRLPEHAELIRSAVDGGETVLGRPANGDYTLRLTSRTSMQSLLLVWRYEDGTEDEHAPRLEEPNLFRRSEESSASATWKVLIPPGNRPEVVEGRAIVGAEVGVILRQATAELDAYRNAFEGIDPQEPPAAALLREIDGLCRKADALLRVRQVRMSLGSYAEILSTRLRELVETRSELAGKKHLDSPTRPIRDLEDWPTEPGLPTYLERTGPTAPVLQLVPENSAQKTSEPMVAILFLGVCLLSAGLSIFPAVRKSLECFGPEMAMVLGIIGWQMVGFSGLALIPLMLGITARLIDIYRWSLSFVYRAV
jgi:hypothetical protein